MDGMDRAHEVLAHERVALSDPARRLDGLFEQQGFGQCLCRLGRRFQTIRDV